jgi:hypothetical protein
LAKSLPGLSVGLHLEFLEEIKTVEAAEQVLNNQYHRFIRLLGKKPTHLDVHKFSVGSVQVGFILVAFAKSRQIKLRGFDQRLIISSFYGQFKGLDQRLIDSGYYGRPDWDKITPDFLNTIVINLKNGKNYLLICHPGYSSSKLADPYNVERKMELSALTNPQIFALIKRRGIKLMNYHRKGSL